MHGITAAFYRARPSYHLLPARVRTRLFLLSRTSYRTIEETVGKQCNNVSKLRTFVPVSRHFLEIPLRGIRNPRIQDYFLRRRYFISRELCQTLLDFSGGKFEFKLLSFLQVSSFDANRFEIICFVPCLDTKIKLFSEFRLRISFSRSTFKRKIRIRVISSFSARDGTQNSLTTGAEERYCFPFVERSTGNLRTETWKRVCGVTHVR